EGIFNTASGDITNITSTIAGSSGLTITGAGSLLLPGANTYTGNTTLDQGTLTLGAGNSISSGPSDRLVITGTATLQGSSSIALGNDFTLASANLTFGNNNMPITFTGTGTLTGFSTLTANDAAGAYFNGKLTGTGQLIVAGNQTLFLTSAGA